MGKVLEVINDDETELTDTLNDTTIMIEKIESKFTKIVDRMSQTVANIKIQNKKTKEDWSVGSGFLWD